MYLDLDNHMMLVYEGGGVAVTLRSLSSYNIIPDLEEIQVLPTCNFDTGAWRCLQFKHRCFRGAMQHA